MTTAAWCDIGICGCMLLSTSLTSSRSSIRQFLPINYPHLPCTHAILSPIIIKQSIKNIYFTKTWAFIFSNYWIKVFEIMLHFATKKETIYCIITARTTWILIGLFDIIFNQLKTITWAGLRLVPLVFFLLLLLLLLFFFCQWEGCVLGVEYSVAAGDVQRCWGRLKSCRARVFPLSHPRKYYARHRQVSF